VNVHPPLYAPIQGGLLGGVFALELSFGGQLRLSPSEFLKQIDRIAASVFPEASHRRILWFDIANLADVEATEMDEVLAVLRDKGFVVIIESNGQSRPAWFNFATALVVSLREKDWLGFSVSAIRYEPPAEDDWVEPRIEANNGSKSRYLVYSSDEVKPTKVLGFLSKAKSDWGIIDSDWRPVAVQCKYTGGSE